MSDKTKKDKMSTTKPLVAVFGATRLYGPLRHCNLLTAHVCAIKTAAIDDE